MNLFYKDDLQDLIENQDGRRISIYMPTERKAIETQQNRIRLKNLLSDLEERLVERGVRSPDAKTLLEPARDMLDDNIFWQHQSDGLAIFLAADSLRYYRLPFDFEELATISERFYIKPLLPLLSGDGLFYILAISQDEVRLLQGSRYSVDRVDLEGVPTSLAEALRFDDPEARLQFHTASAPSGGAGGRPAMFHGHGGFTQEEKVDILRYFQKVDAGLQETFGGQHAPLILAGVDYLLPIYREANTYAHLLDEGLEGNPEKLSARELHQSAWHIVQPYFLQAEKEAAGQYRQLANTEQATDDLDKIVPAAYFGRIDTLFVALEQQAWGDFDPEANQVTRHEEREPGDQDLLDLAAVHTLLNGGSIYALETNKMPSDGAVAAVLRY